MRITLNPNARRPKVMDVTEVEVVFDNGSALRIRANPRPARSVNIWNPWDNRLEIARLDDNAAQLKV